MPVAEYSQIIKNCLLRPTFNPPQAPCSWVCCVGRKVKNQSVAGFRHGFSRLGLPVNIWLFFSRSRLSPIGQAFINRSGSGGSLCPLLLTACFPPQGGWVSRRHIRTRLSPPLGRPRILAVPPAAALLRRCLRASLLLLDKVSTSVLCFL